MSTVMNALRALLDFARQLLKGKTPASSDKIRETIARFDEQLIDRPAQRGALEREWADSILYASVQDQAAHRVKLEAFDLETDQGVAARAALQRVLEETIAREDGARVDAIIGRGRELIDQHAALVDTHEAAATAHAAALSKLHAASAEFYDIRREAKKSGREEELLQGVTTEHSTLMNHEILSGFGIFSARKHVVTRLRDDTQLWPLPHVPAEPMLNATPHGTELRI